jgi:hypothetical protein
MMELVLVVNVSAAIASAKNSVKPYKLNYTKAKQVEYPKDLKSAYQREYPWKKAAEKEKQPPSNYKPNSEYLNKESTYLEHYKPF